MNNGTQNIQSFWAVGLNYKKTDASVRGAFAISIEQYGQALALAHEYGVDEMFIVSTCNRTEIYGCAAYAHQLVDLLCRVCAGNAATFTQMAYVRNGYEAAEHLFQVAAGLDSQILGDFEILGQIKKSVKYAKENGFIGAFMDRLVNCVFQSSKSVKTNTAISGGTVSVSFAAVQYIRDNVHNISDKKILLLGAGKIGTITCRNMIDYLGTKNITLINRTTEAAQNLAGELGIQYQQIGCLDEHLKSADIIVVSTSAQEPVVFKNHLAGHGPKIVIDLSVPCNVSNDVREIDNITLINVDELSAIKDETLQMRRNEIPKAVLIIKEHLQDFKEWYAMRKHVPVLKEVKSKLQGIYLTGLSTEAKHEVKQTDAIQSVINVLATKMRSKHAPGCHYIEAINDFISHHG